MPKKSATFGSVVVFSFLIVLVFGALWFSLDKDPSTQPRAITTADEKAVLASTMGVPSVKLEAQSWLMDHKKVTTTEVDLEIEGLSILAKAQLLETIHNK